MVKNPIQPIVEVGGVLRFKENKIVRELLDHASKHGFDLNEISRRDFSRDDRIQFAQLIGYSQSGFGSLGYVDNETYDAAEHMRTGMAEKDARLAYYDGLVATLRKSMRDSIAALYEKHPDDLLVVDDE